VPELNRREFIKFSGLSGITLGLGISGYFWLGMQDEVGMRQSYVPQDIQGLTEEETLLLYLASLAPSGHNTQPWTITSKGPKRWLIGSERTRWLPGVDPENRELMLSIGAFIENVSVAAGIHGYEAKVNIIGQDNFSQAIADVRLVPKTATGISDQVIKQRRTIRKHLQKTAITREDIKHLVANNHSKIMYYPLASKEGTYLKDATLLANKAQVYRDDAQAELANWIRWTEGEAREYGNGLSPESMEMEGIMRWYAKHFLGKKDVLSKTFREETIKLVEEQVQNCAGWLVIASDNSTVADLIEAGRVLQAAWLRAYEKSIAFHPMTQVLEENPWQAEVAKELGHSGKIQFIIRIGYVKTYSQPVSLRMPMSKIITV
jgi:hypothetical protein